MSDGEIIALAALGLGGFWLLTRKPADAAPAVTPAPHAGAWQQVASGVEAAATKITGVPVAAIGNAAASAPTWLKVAVLPVGATALAQQTITHPVDTAKAVGSGVKTAATATYSATKSAISAVGNVLGF